MVMMMVMTRCWLTCTVQLSNVCLVDHVLIFHVYHWKMDMLGLGLPVHLSNVCRSAGRGGTTTPRRTSTCCWKGWSMVMTITITIMLMIVMMIMRRRSNNPLWWTMFSNDKWCRPISKEMMIRRLWYYFSFKDITICCKDIIFPSKDTSLHRQLCPQWTGEAK